MRIKLLCSGAALWVLLAGQAYAAESAADQWLQRLQSARDTQSYQGTFIYERKGSFLTHQVWRHINPAGQRVERFVQLNGPAHEMVRIDGQVACMSATIADALAVVDLWPTEAIKTQQLQEWYEVLLLGESREAGRMTTVLLFSPLDQHRYPVEIYIDQATAIPLKTLLLNEQGQLLERLQFVQFEAESDSISAEESQALLGSANCLPVSKAAVVTDTEKNTKNWTVHWIPPGFKLLKSHFQPAANNASYVLSQVYSDGLTHFSVFYENVDNLEVEGGRRQLGPTAVVSRKVVQGAENLMVTVVGEIPIGSAERIALSMHAGQEQADD